MGSQPFVYDLVARMRTDPGTAQAVLDLAKRIPQLRNGLLEAMVADSDDHSLQKHTVGPPIAVPPPPGLEHTVPTVPASAVAKAPVAGLPTTGTCTDIVNEQRAKVPPPREARRRTLVLAYFPRGASDMKVCSALDVALGKMHTVRRCRVVRDSEGNGLYGFFEFQDPETMESALAACSRGSVVLNDQWGHKWHIRASRSERATVADSESNSSRRRRGKRGGVAQRDAA